MTRTLDGLESALAVCQLSSPPYLYIAATALRTSTKLLFIEPG